MRAAFVRREGGIALLLATTVLAVQIVNPGFLGLANIRDLLVQCAPFVVLATGMAFVVLVREIDISVGSMVGVLAALLGLACSPQHWGWPPVACAALVVVAGGVLGLVNGVLVAVAKVPSIIVTLGMLTVLRGVTEVLLGGKWVTGIPSGVRSFGIGQVVGVPVPVLVGVVCALLGGWAASQTPWGRRVYAIGSSPEVGAVRGLPVVATKIQVFVLMGLLTGVATLVSVPQLSVIESGLGTGWELFVVTCVVVGGVSITGGKGSVFGVVLAVVLLGIVKSVLIFLRLGDQATFWEQAIQGAFILAAVLADRVARRRVRSEALA